MIGWETFCMVEVRVASARCSSCSTRAVSSLSLVSSSLSLSSVESSEPLVSLSEGDGVTSNCTVL